MNYNSGSTSGSSTGGGINQIVDTNIAGGVNSNFNKKHMKDLKEFTVIDDIVKMVNFSTTLMKMVIKSNS